jgi:hypothetical protein
LIGDGSLRNLGNFNGAVGEIGNFGSTCRFNDGLTNKYWIGINGR